MCGIFGFIHPTGNYSKDRQKFISDYMVVGQLRGTHGTGIYSLHKQGNSESIIYAKRAVCGSDAVQLNSFKEPLQDASSDRIVVGHNRHSTHGGNTDENTHPFIISHKDNHIVGVHNGMATGIKETGRHAVDSYNVFHSMAHAGEMETLEELKGAYALVWWNQKEGVLNIARNNNRPLHVAKTKDGGMFFGSEAEMLLSLMKRNGLDAVSMHSVMPFHWYKIDPDKPSKWTSQKYDEPAAYSAPSTTSRSSTPSMEGTFMDRNPRRVTKTEREILNESGYRIGQRVEVVPLSFTNTYRSDVGTLAALAADNDSDVIFKINNITSNEYEILEDTTITAAITSASSVWSGTSGRYQYTIFLSPNYEIMWDVEDEEEDLTLPDVMVQGPKGMEKAEIVQGLLDFGCGECGADIDVEDADFISWYPSDAGIDTPICADCTDALHKEQAR